MAVDTCRRHPLPMVRAPHWFCREGDKTLEKPRGILPATAMTMVSARVLVADDDADMLAAVSDALSSLGFEVRSVDNGAGLIDCLATDGPFDLLVTDISMPWMDSLKTLRSIRTAGVTTPVIVITALTDAQIPSRVQALGANAILLRKPFDLDELAAAAQRMTAGSPAGTEQQR